MKKALCMALTILLLATASVYAISIVDSTFTNDPDSIECTRDLPPSIETFDAQTDKEFWIYLYLQDVSAGDTMKVDWYFEGELYSASEPYLFTEDAWGTCRAHGYPITNTEREYMTGYWYAEVFLNGIKRQKTGFYLQGLPTTTTTSISPPPNLEQFRGTWDFTFYTSVATNTYTYYLYDMVEIEGEPYLMGYDTDYGVMAGINWFEEVGAYDLYAEYDLYDLFYVFNLTGENSVAGDCAFILNGDISATYPFTGIKVAEYNPGFCFLSLIYGEQSEKTKTLRQVRDSILSKTPEGQELVKLYYQWSPIIVRAMEADEEFKEEIKEAVDKVLGLIGEVK